MNWLNHVKSLLFVKSQIWDRPKKTTHVAMSRMVSMVGIPKLLSLRRSVAPDSADQRPLRCAKHSPSVASLRGSHPPRAAAGRCGRLGHDLSIKKWCDLTHPKCRLIYVYIYIYAYIYMYILINYI